MPLHKQLTVSMPATKRASLMHVARPTVSTTPQKHQPKSLPKSKMIRAQTRATQDNGAALWENLSQDVVTVKRKMDYFAMSRAGRATPALVQSAGKIVLLITLITVRSASNPSHMAEERVVQSGHGRDAIVTKTSGALSATPNAEMVSTTLAAASAHPTAQVA